MLADADRPPPVSLLQEWLARRCDAIPKTGAGAEYLLLPHCSERSLALSSLRHWQSAFAAAGANLRLLPSGCCGMAGTFGHEAEHRATSEQIYGMSWARHARALDRRNVDKDIRTAAIRCNETIPFCGIEPLHSTKRHAKLSRSSTVSPHPRLASV